MTCLSQPGGRRKSARAAFCASCFRTAEALEPRVLFSTFTVTNTNDSGLGSLRQAILDANASVGLDGIAFNIPGPSPHVIAPQSPLPTVTDPLDMEGVTQPGFQQGTGAPAVVLSGSNAGPSADGLVFGPTAGGSTLRGLVVNQFGRDGVVLQGAGDRMSDCYVGTDASGMIAAGNGGNGVVVSAGGISVGVYFADRNVISGNRRAGIVVTTTTSATFIDGNLIGTNATGTAAIGNGHEGVLASGPVSIAGGNVISGNGYSGVVLSQGSPATTLVTGCYIGTDAYGTAAIPNGTAPLAPYRDGITVLSGGATIGQIANAAAVPVNVISGNRGAGIALQESSQAVIQSNLIGTDVSGSLPLGNGGDGIVSAGDGLKLSPNRPTTLSILAYGGNVIAANGGDGILLMSSNDLVNGQYVGVNIAGGKLGNRGNGIEIRGGFGDTIGGNSNNLSPFFVRNIISGNGGAGVLIQSSASSVGNIVTGNYIGVRINGAAPLGNGGDGVDVLGANDTVSGNVIGGNAGSGIFLGPIGSSRSYGNTIQNNLIGVFPREAPADRLYLPARRPA